MKYDLIIERHNNWNQRAVDTDVSPGKLDFYWPINMKKREIILIDVRQPK